MKNKEVPNSLLHGHLEKIKIKKKDMQPKMKKIEAPKITNMKKRAVSNPGKK